MKLIVNDIDGIGDNAEQRANASLIAAAPDAHRILTRLGFALRDGSEPSLYAKMDTGETIADAIEAYLKKVEVE